MPIEFQLSSSHIKPIIPDWIEYLHWDKLLENGGYSSWQESRFYIFFLYNKTLNIHIIMKRFGVKNKLNTSFLTLLAEMSPFDLPFKVFRTFDAF